MITILCVWAMMDGSTLKRRRDPWFNPCGLCLRKVSHDTSGHYAFLTEPMLVGLERGRTYVGGSIAKVD